MFPLFWPRFFQDVADVCKRLSWYELVGLHGWQGLDSLDELGDVERLSEGVERGPPLDDDGEDGRLEHDLGGGERLRDGLQWGSLNTAESKTVSRRGQD